MRHRSRRYRVASRPRSRGQYAKRAASGAAMLLVMFSAIIALRHLRWDATPWSVFKASLKSRAAVAASGTAVAKPHHAVALISLKSRQFLDDQGEIFTSEAGLSAISSPLVECGKASSQELAQLAVFLAGTSAKFPSPIERVSYVSFQEGWRIKLSDGTSLLWGDLKWTDEKLRRLGQVLADARSEFANKELTADLRYFEDGRILLRPAGVR